MAEKQPKKKTRKTGEGTLFQRTDGRWQASFIPENGKRLYFYGKTASEALEKMRKAKEEERKGILATGPKQKLGDYLTSWLETVQRPTIKKNTYVQYRMMINRHIIPALGQTHLQKLTAPQVQSFYSQKLQDGLSPGTVGVIHAVLHCALENAVKWNLVTRNVSSLVSPPKRSGYEVHTLSPGEAIHLIEAAKETNLEAIIIMAVTTGIRRGELMALRWSDIDLERGMLHIRRTMYRLSGFGFVENTPKTRTSKRRIILPAVVVEALKEHQQRQIQAQKKAGSKWIDKGLVFPNTHGNFIRPDHMLRKFHQLLDSAKLPYMRFHDLRHSAATILLIKGVHPKVVQDLLGHSTIAMTMDTYSHLLPSMQQDAADSMDDVFRKKNDSTDVDSDVNKTSDNDEGASS
jgi:integrase